MRVSVRNLKAPIISKQGKRLLLLATTRKIMEELRRESCNRGHHTCIYKEIYMYDPAISCKKNCIGEVVQCERAPRKAVDRYSVAMMNEELMLNICHEGYPDCVRSFCDEDVPSKNFRVSNFRIFGGIRKYLYTENFRICGITCRSVTHKAAMSVLHVEVLCKASTPLEVFTHLHMYMYVL